MGTLRFAHPTPTGSLPFNELALNLAPMGPCPIGARLRIKCLKNKLYLSTTEFPW
jgi:hypothetical protein